MVISQEREKHSAKWRNPLLGLWTQLPYLWVYHRYILRRSLEVIADVPELKALQQFKKGTSGQTRYLFYTYELHCGYLSTFVPWQPCTTQHTKVVSGDAMPPLPRRSLLQSSHTMSRMLFTSERRRGRRRGTETQGFIHPCSILPWLPARISVANVGGAPVHMCFDCRKCQTIHESVRFLLALVAAVAFLFLN